MKRGTVVLKEYAARLNAERLEQHVVLRCVWCPKWSTTGTLKDAKTEAKKHRETHHPGVKETRRISRAGTLPMVTQKPIHENIAAVRAQGGATWDGATG